ncbi:MAG: S41 family peptidase, partial [Clostridium sp.]
MEDLNNGGNKKKLITKRVISTTLLVLIFLGSNLLFFYIGNKYAFDGFTVMSVNTEVAKDLKDIKDVKKYSLLFQVRDTLLAKYDGEINDEQLLEGAIKGMTSSLKDPYTVYMNGREYTDFMEQSEGHFVGIGAQVGIKEGKITIIAPMEGSPAAKAGVLAGDVILKVDGAQVEANVDKVISMIRGEEGKDVTLTLQRGSDEPFDINIKREVVKTISVKGEMINSNTGYIQLNTFDENVGKDLEEKINLLK